MWVGLQTNKNSHHLTSQLSLAVLHQKMSHVFSPIILIWIKLAHRSRQRENLVAFLQLKINIRHQVSDIGSLVFLCNFRISKSRSWRWYILQKKVEMTVHAKECLGKNVGHHFLLVRSFLAISSPPSSLAKLRNLINYSQCTKRAGKNFGGDFNRGFSI